jgi:RNA polymerase sigma-70 factor (ECF subfamily)
VTDTDDRQPLVQLALHAASGDRDAQAALVQRTYSPVWQFIIGLTDPESAPDLLQETYLRAFQTLRSVDRSTDITVWLLRIARQKCTEHDRLLTHQRRLRRRVALSVTPDAELRPHDWPELMDLLSRLNADQRAAFVLTQVLGYSYAEVARIEDVPCGAVRSRVAGARDQLVSMLRGSPLHVAPEPRSAS